MNSRLLAACAACTVAFVSVASISVAQAGTKSIDLPPDGVQLVPSALPGYAKAQVNCVACHSAEYMQYQPPNASRAYWDTMAKRMKVVFKAPIADEDIPVIVDYLVKTYGAEKPK